MLRHRIVVGPREFLLAEDTDITALKAATNDAFRSGGGFVDVPAVENRTVSFYCTPGLPVVFESDITDSHHAGTGDIAFPYDDYQLLELGDDSYRS
jgi:hypothetical protein